MRIIFPFLLGLCFSTTLYAESIRINSEMIETMEAPLVKNYDRVVDIQGCFPNVKEVFYELLSLPNPGDRKNFSPGHLTASALIFNPAGDKVLLIHHKRLHQMVYPGGHSDQEEDGDNHFLLKTVLREIQEEIGHDELVLIPSKLGGVYPHFFQVFPSAESPKESAHYHFDAAYIFKALTEEISIDQDEANKAFWVSLKELEVQYRNQEVLKNDVSLDTCALCLKGHRIFKNYKNQLSQLLKYGLFQCF